jgi:SOS response regulatory protein OraA/RecX
VTASLIDSALAALDRTGQLDEARRLARRRLAGLARVAPEKAAPRLRDYLLRRGFPGGVVSQVVRESLRVPREAD